MSTHACRWPVVVLVVVPALFFLSGCGAGSNSDQTHKATVPTITSISPASVDAGTDGFSLTVTGTNFVSASTVRWNTTALATTYVGPNELTAVVPAVMVALWATASITVVNPSPGGGTSAAAVLTVNKVASRYTHVITLGMTVAGMVWDPSRGRIYATVPGTVANGNSVVAIDPATGATAAPVYVGSSPNLVALASNASHLWVSLDGTSAIQRLTLPNLAPDVRIDLAPDPFFGPQVALAMQAAPVDPNTLAVLLSDVGRHSADIDDLAIYDGAVQRPVTPLGIHPVNMTWLQWGPDDDTLYSVGGGGHDLHVLGVDATGVRPGTDYGNFFRNAKQSHYDRSTGRVYADDGRVFDPATGVLVGTFNMRDFLPSACLPDPVEPVVFYLGHESSLTSSYAGYTLRAFDKNTYRLVGSLRIPLASGTAGNLIRWGRAGIAFNTVPEVTGGGTAAVHIVDGPFIASSAEPDFTSGTEAELMPVFTAIAPESATVGSAGLVLTVSGSQFQPFARVFWDGQALDTTYRSSTELQAFVPASRLAEERSATISIANDLSRYAVAVNSLAFTVQPVSSGVIVRNLSSLDIAWDSHSSRLYAPVWSADPQYPNSVVATDPATGSISKVAGVGSDPHVVSISRDGTLGYVGYQVANFVTQFHVPALDSMVSWSLGADSFLGPFHAGDIQPAPDTAQTTAITVDVVDSSPANHGLVIFDDAVARPQRPYGFGQEYNTIQWGLTDTVLYAADKVNSQEFELYTIGVDATGGTLLRTAPRAWTWTSGLTMHFDGGTGYIYCDDGYVTDPATGRQLGSYNAAGLLVPDSALNRVFILRPASSVYGSPDYTILSFDQSHFTAVSSLTIRNLVGTPVAFIRWGTSGLAIVTYNKNWGPTSGPAGMLYILDNPTFFSATQRVQAGVENLTVGLTWQPGRSAFSTSRRSPRSAESAGRVFLPYSKGGVRDPKDRQGPSR